MEATLCEQEGDSSDRGVSACACACVSTCPHACAHVCVRWCEGGRAGHTWILASGVLCSPGLSDAKITLDILLTELSSRCYF